MKQASLDSTAMAMFRGGLVLWVGGAWLFSAVVLPGLFAGLERSLAGDVAALLFPAYYRLGLGAGVAAVLGAGWMARGDRPWAIVVAVLMIMLACQGWAVFVLQPHMAELRGLESARAEFMKLHGWSMALNSVVLLAGSGLVLFGGRFFGRR
jgi:hypothetical protein